MLLEHSSMSPGSTYKHARIDGDFDAIVIGSGAGGTIMMPIGGGSPPIPKHP